jgi:hypothetical protein
MADKFKEFQKRFKAGKVKMQANPPPLPGPGGIVRAGVGKALQMAGSSWRQKITEASNRPYKGRGSGVPAKVTKPRGNINRAYTQESIKMSAPGRSSSTALTTAPTSRAVTTGTSRALTITGRNANSSVRVVGVSGRTAAIAASKAGMPVGSKTAKTTVAGRPDVPVGSYMPKKKATSSSSKYAGYGNKTSSAAYGYTPKNASPIMPTVSMAGGGVNKPASKSVEAAKEKIKAGRQGQAKKKTGATTGATPAKRRTNLDRMRRRQAERFAISSSGRSL